MPRSTRAFQIRRLAAAGLLIDTLGFCPVVMADAVEDFYRGKTITLLIGYTPGGTYDAYGRLVARFMGDHIPGKPTIVPRNMPGAASRVAVAHLYNVAPRDGTMLATSPSPWHRRWARSCSSTSPN
jgi:tripartite-type tricarboxylate transporter receptor subunit TctC